MSQIYVIIISIQFQIKMNFIVSIQSFYWFLIQIRDFYYSNKYLFLLWDSPINISKGFFFFYIFINFFHAKLICLIYFSLNLWAEKLLFTEVLGQNQFFSNFLPDAPLVTKFDFYSPPNKLIEYCWHFFFLNLTGWHNKQDFFFSFKIKIFTEFRKVNINGILNLIKDLLP